MYVYISIVDIELAIVHKRDIVSLSLQTRCKLSDLLWLLPLITHQITICLHNRKIKQNQQANNG